MSLYFWELLQSFPLIDGRHHQRAWAAYAYKYSHPFTGKIIFVLCLLRSGGVGRKGLVTVILATPSCTSNATLAGVTETSTSKRESKGSSSPSASSPKFAATLFKSSWRALVSSYGTTGGAPVMASSSDEKEEADAVLSPKTFSTGPSVKVGLTRGGLLHGCICVQMWAGCHADHLLEVPWADPCPCDGWGNPQVFQGCWSWATGPRAMVPVAVPWRALVLPILSHW